MAEWWRCDRLLLLLWQPFFISVGKRVLDLSRRGFWMCMVPVLKQEGNLSVMHAVIIWRQHWLFIPFSTFQFAWLRESKMQLFLFFWFIDIMLWPRQQSTQLLLCLTETRQKTSWLYCLPYFPRAEENFNKEELSDEIHDAERWKNYSVFMNAVQNKGMYASHWDSTRIWDKCLFQWRRLIVKCQPNTQKGKTEKSPVVKRDRLNRMNQIALLVSWARFGF